MPILLILILHKNCQINVTPNFPDIWYVELPLDFVGEKMKKYQVSFNEISSNKKIKKVGMKKSKETKWNE